MQFSDLELSLELRQAVEEAGYEAPTPIQEAAIPVVLRGDDLLGCAQTGTGKTASFLLPLLQRIASGRPVTDHPANARLQRSPRVLVMTPTRELAAQVAARALDYGKHVPATVGLAHGGAGIGPQIEALKQGIDLLVATPGRLLDLLERGDVELIGVESFVLDEVDRMLDMGFFPDVKNVCRYLPKKRQMLFFSATVPEEVEELIAALRSQPVVVEAGPRARPVDSVEQTIYPVARERKLELLLELLQSVATGRVLIFVSRKSRAEWVARSLSSARYRVMAIHGDKSQNQRQQAIEKFHSGKIDLLVATDLAGRGIDFEEVTHVVNFDMPSVPEDYVHRIGRTARAEASGAALSLVDPDDMPLVRRVERLIQMQLRRQVVAGFEPLPGSVEGDAGRRTRKPRPAGRWGKPPGERRRQSSERRDDRGGAGASRRRSSRPDASSSESSRKSTRKSRKRPAKKGRGGKRSK